MSHLTITGKPCALPDEHNGHHRTVEAHERHMAGIRKWQQSHVEHRRKWTNSYRKTQAGKIGRMLEHARVSSGKTGNPCTITREWLESIWSDSCPYCGREWEDSGQGVPSIDKIIPSRGYVPGNVAIVCLRCNARKQDMTPADMRQMADNIDAELSRQSDWTSLYDGGKLADAEGELYCTTDACEIRR